MPQRFAMSRPYLTALESVGAAAVLFPLDISRETMRTLFDTVDAIFLAGGGDMNPHCYRADAYQKTEGIDDLRDSAELIYAQWALDENKPLLGVCRGVQALNVAAGGTLMQDITDMHPDSIRHQYFPEFPREYVAHPVETIPGSRLEGILGRDAHVNSFHHQAVLQLAEGFQVAAIAPDGVIEAIEHPTNTFALGVQWHPESLIDKDHSMLDLFKAFVSVA